MAEIHIPYLPSAKFFKIRCRLGIHEQDIASDTDSDPQIRTIGGTVTIATSVTRFRYTEADGRARVVYNKTETYNIQTATGELFDADGNLGVHLLDTTSPGVDPQGWTYTATVRPEGGAPFDAVIPSGWTGEAFDLGDGLVFSPSTGITDLETRVKALEDAPGGGSSFPIQHVTLASNHTQASSGWPTDQPVAVVYTQDATGSRTVTYASSIDGAQAPVRTAANSQTIVEFYPLGGGRWRAFSDYSTGAPAPGPDPDPTDTTAPAWSATFTMGTPTSTAVVATASVLATDNVLVAGYEVSYDGGGSWHAIVPSGTNFTLSGTAGQTYSQTRLRAKDAGGNYSPVLSVPAYSLPGAGGTYAITYRDSQQPTSISAMAPFVAGVAVPLGAPTATRTVIVAISTRNTGPGQWVACTVGGITATRLDTATPASMNCPAMFAAVVPNGTTTDVVLEWNKSSLSSVRVSVWTVDGLVEPVASGVASARSASAVSEAAGMVFALGWDSAHGATITPNLAADYAGSPGANGTIVVSHADTDGSPVTYTWTAVGGDPNGNHRTLVQTLRRKP